MCKQQGGPVESRRDFTWILGLCGFRVLTTESGDDTTTSRLTIRIERCGAPNGSSSQI
jgi:hypothetical protein